MRGEAILVRGQVQGVGFRPTVWRLATEMGLTGEVRNSGEGVEIRLWGAAVEHFTTRLNDVLPPLARIDAIHRTAIDGHPPADFVIAPSDAGRMRVAITPDVASCADCLAEIRDPFARRYRYPFTNCTHCGPRFSIVRGAPYDRRNTVMAPFPLCPACDAEYRDPGDRRFHAQPIACHVCGPRVWLEHLGGGAINHEAFSMLDDVDAVGGMLMMGHIVAIKGLGAFHLACDATKPEVVARLRAAKRRPSKPLALMARDLDVIRRYARVSPAEAALLSDPAAPIVLLAAEGEALPETVAPGTRVLGFMLPHTPLHHLMLRRMTRPIIMTSGNSAGDPPCTRNEEARARLAGIADFALMHDRDIANRIDDSVVRIIQGVPCVLRRARGYAPAEIDLPAGFSHTMEVLALGGEVKNAFCLVKNGKAILSQHIGNLQNPEAVADWRRNLALYRQLYDSEPGLIAVDAHPDYAATRAGEDFAAELGCPVLSVQHHHAHIAACLAENGWALDGDPVLGIALDGLGLGNDGTLWGGEFLVCDYQAFERAGCLKPVALPGGEQAVREPWRSAYAHLMAEMGWAEFAMNFDGLDLYAKLQAAPRATLDAMIARSLNAPLSSSCGRLFDAAAAMCGLAWDRQSYEGEAAMRLEAAIDPAAMQEPEDLAYPFSLPLLGGRGLPYIEPLAVWRALLGDLYLGTSVGTIAARFHRGLAKAVTAMAARIAEARSLSTVALSGGCFQNAVLTELVRAQLEARGLRVLGHHSVPMNDGGLALGQAVIALATSQAKGG